MDCAIREELTLAPTRRAPALARRAVRDFVSASSVASDAHTAELLASELVTNAITHGCGWVKVLMECDAAGLAITVCDDHPGEPEIAPQTPMALGGRGLRMVDVLAQAWGVTPAPDGSGKGVWFRLARAS